MTALGEFLFPAPAPRRAGAIIRWWEKRRLAYNLMVGAAGLVSAAAVSVWSPLVGEGSVLGFIWIPAVIFGGLANVCYTLGSLIEILVQKLWGSSVLPIGPAMYRMGLTFSVGLALFPTLLITLFVVVRVVAYALGG